MDRLKGYKTPDVTKLSLNEIARKIRIKKKLKLLFSLYRWVTLFCIGIVLLYPLLNMLTISLRPVEQLADPLVIWIPKSLTIENLKVAWQGLDFGNAAYYSFILTIVSTIFQVISCAMAGYGFARFRFKGRNWLFIIVLFTILVPPQTVIIPKYLQYWQFDFFGLGSIFKLLTGKALSVNLLGTLWTMFIPAILGNGIRGGLFIYIFRQFFRGMPKELEDAANIDGCGPFQAFTRIMVPGASVAFVTVIIFSVVWYWNDFLNTIMYMGNIPTVSPKLMILNSKLAQLLSSGTVTGFQNEEVNPYRMSAAIQAGCLLVTAPLVFMYSFLQKYFTESIERTGIVG